MAKRVADKYLTDQNWDQEDNNAADEGPGTFREADEAVLKNRVIRKAKRRAPQGQMSDAAAFAGFSGFKTSVTPNTNSGGAFGGLHGNGTSGAQATGFFLQTAQTGAEQSKFSAVLGSRSTAQASEGVQVAPSISKSSDDGESTKTLKEYNIHLSALNKSVSKWIKNHVEKNPLCDLTPIFLDYKKHLSNIEGKYGHSDSETSSSSTQTSDSQDMKSSQDSSQPSLDFLSEKPKFSLSGFGPKPYSTGEDSSQVQESSPMEPLTNKTLFTGFQMVSSGLKTSPFKGFNNEASTKGPAFGGFSFSSSMVGAGSQNTDRVNQQSSGQNADEEYVPPKAESNVVVEEDAFFTIRCKLYYKKDESFVDRGVGQLYLKPCGSKTQLLIRADTAISQILLNILLVSSIPVKKQGKNNILIMCIPNPPINEREKDKVTPLLIRVKTGDDADKLLEIMEQKKKEASEAES